MGGLGPSGIAEVAAGLVALGIAGIVWGLVTTDIMGEVPWLTLIGGAALLVAGLGIVLWDRSRSASKPR